MRRDANGHGAHLSRPRDLKAVGSVVLKARGLEQSVELPKDVCEAGRHSGEDSGAAVWNTGRRVGAWRSLVARTVRVGEVPGSNPGAPISSWLDAGVGWGAAEGVGSSSGDGILGRRRNEGGSRACVGCRPDRPRTAHAESV